jgi:hypothetical protein
MWDLWCTKWRWGRFSPSTSVSPANLYPTKFSILTITRDRYNRPVNGRPAVWTKFGLHLSPCELKKLATSYGLEDSGVGVQIPLGSRIFFSPRRPGRLWGPPNLQWVPEALSPEVKRPGREDDHSPPTSAEVKKI